MPRGRLMFHAMSPPDPDWLRDPEDHVRQVMKKHGAEYQEGSLDFSLDGRIGYCLFNSFEPSGDDPGTSFYGFAEELDGIDVTLHISLEVWRQRFGGDGATQVS